MERIPAGSEPWEGVREFTGPRLEFYGPEPAFVNVSRAVWYQPEPAPLPLIRRQTIEALARPAGDTIVKRGYWKIADAAGNWRHYTFGPQGVIADTTSPRAWMALCPYFVDPVFVEPVEPTTFSPSQLRHEKRHRFRAIAEPNPYDKTLSLADEWARSVMRPGVGKPQNLIRGWRLDKPVIEEDTTHWAVRVSGIHMHDRWKNLVFTTVPQRAILPSVHMQKRQPERLFTIIPMHTCISSNLSDERIRKAPKGIRFTRKLDGVIIPSNATDDYRESLSLLNRTLSKYERRSKPSGLEGIEGFFRPLEEAVFQAIRENGPQPLVRCDACNRIVKMGKRGQITIRCGRCSDRIRQSQKRAGDTRQARAVVQPSWLREGISYYHCPCCLLWIDFKKIERNIEKRDAESPKRPRNDWPLMENPHVLPTFDPRRTENELLRQPDDVPHLYADGAYDLAVPAHVPDQLGSAGDWAIGDFEVEGVAVADEHIESVIWSERSRVDSRRRYIPKDEGDWVAELLSPDVKNDDHDVAVEKLRDTPLIIKGPEAAFLFGTESRLSYREE